MFRTGSDQSIYTITQQELTTLIDSKDFHRDVRLIIVMRWMATITIPANMFFEKENLLCKTNAVLLSFAKIIILNKFFEHEDSPHQCIFINSVHLEKINMVLGS